MKTLLEILTEGKQVGTIYHYTSLKNCTSILKSNQMLSKQIHLYWLQFKNRQHQDGNRYDVISFTRDKNFHKAPYGRTIGADVECRLTIDGDSLSNRYKLTPYSEPGFTRKRPQEYESEVRIQSLSPFTINNIIKYVKSVEILQDAIQNDTQQTIYDSLMQICNTNNIPLTILDKKAY